MTIATQTLFGLYVAYGYAEEQFTGELYTSLDAAKAGLVARADGQAAEGWRVVERDDEGVYVRLSSDDGYLTTLTINRWR